MIHYSGIKQYMLVNGWNGPNYVQEQSLVRFLGHILVFVFKFLLVHALDRMHPLHASNFSVSFTP